jgi:thioesterase domain-containing protein/acyl carrier protein
MWGALLHGGRLVIVPYVVSRSPAEFLELIADEGVTVLNQTPSAFRLLLQAVGRKALSKPLALRFVIFAGEALDIQSLRPWFERYGDAVPQLVNMYGITEITVHGTYRPVTIKDLASARSMIGIPFPDLKIHLLDRHRQPVPIGAAGEIYVGGDGVARGYLNRPELDRERFIADPFGSTPGAQLYKSGDLARYHLNGDLEYLGRLDNQVKIRGFRVELGEIETILGQQPDVAAAIVRVQEEQAGDKRLVAYVVPKDRERAPAIAALRRYLAEKLPDYMVPAVFLTIDRLPLTGNGKIDYRALPVPGTTTIERERILVPPRDDVEQRLARLWEKILKVRAIDVRDNFFDLGGHSLSAVHLMAEIERDFGRNLPIATLFRNPTIEKLGVSLRSEADQAPWSPLVTIQPAGSATPFFCVAGGGGNVLYYYRLAQRLPTGRPFYGLQSIGLDGRCDPLSQVEEMACEYLRVVRRVQPHGPYLLGGHCFGGWVAFEMAQQLRRDGEEIALLTILDAPAPHPTMSRLDEDHSDDAAWIAKLGAALAEDAGTDLGIDYATLRTLEPDAQLVYFRDRMQAAGLLPPEAGMAQVRGFVRVFIANSRARYLPKDAQPLRIALFRAGDFHRDYDYSVADDPTLGWSAYALGDVAVRAVPGNHITMLSEPRVAVLAEQVSQCLEQFNA